MFITGNQAIGMGAIMGGCKFYAAYPMTPASGVLHYLAPHAHKYGLVVKQCEDEISAMNMAVGAGHLPWVSIVLALSFLMLLIFM